MATPQRGHCHGPLQTCRPIPKVHAGGARCANPARAFPVALDFLVDRELDLSALHARYNNNETGAPAYDPSVLLKIDLLAYRRGLISSRSIEGACRENVLFMALSGDSTPQFTTIAKFIRELGSQIGALFTQVLLSRHQVIVAAVAHGSGSEQSTLLPAVQMTDAVRYPNTLITADAGYHSEANLKGLHDQRIPALVADNLMRRRDERFASQGKYKALPDPLADKSASVTSGTKDTRLFGPKDFRVDASTNTCICPAGQHLYSNGSHCVTRGRVSHKFTGTKAGCGPCLLRSQCLRHPDRTSVRQVSFFAKDQASPHQFTERMKQTIDSPRGRRLYSQRMATVEPVFANLRHNKQLNRFTLRTQPKVNAQWTLYCLVHNIEKLARNGFAQ